MNETRHDSLAGIVIPPRAGITPLMTISRACSGRLKKPTTPGKLCVLLNEQGSIEAYCESEFIDLLQSIISHEDRLAIHINKEPPNGPFCTQT
jgi:hypothetical protein